MTTGNTAVDAITLLPLPSYAELSEQQVRGNACVWDGSPLTTTAVDLGQRRVQLADGHLTMSPRACPRCVAGKALPALHEHALTCDECMDEAFRCEMGRALWRLVREGWR